MKKLILILFFSLFIFNFVNAKSSDLFINHLSNIVFDDCRDKDITIKDNFIKNTLTDKSVTLITWPYNQENIRRIIELFSEIEPFDNYFAGCNSGKSGYFMGKDGCKILTCGDHWLDITNIDYSWDGIRVEVPREEFNNYYAQTSGDNSPATAGNNNEVLQKNTSWLINLFWSEGTIGGVILTILLSGAVWILKRMLYDKWKSKQKHKKEKGGK